MTITVSNTQSDGESLSAYVRKQTESHEEGSGSPENNEILLTMMLRSAEHLMTLLRYNADDSPTLHATYIRATAELWEAASLLGNQELRADQNVIVTYLKKNAKEAMALLMTVDYVLEGSDVESKVLHIITFFHSCIEMVQEERRFA